MKILLSQGVKWQLDPNQTYSYLTHKEIVDFCGFLPKTVTKTDMHLIHDELVKKISQRYGTGMNSCGIGTMKDNAILVLTGSEELSPLMSAELKGEQTHSIHLYPYGLFSVVSNNNQSNSHSLFFTTQ